MNLVKNKAIGLLICILLLMLTSAAWAYEPIDTEKSASLTLTFCPNGKNASYVEFYLYRAASVSPSGQFTLTDKFNKYPLSLNNLTGSGRRALAQTMAAYAEADGIARDLSAETNSQGTAHFSNLKPGLYLITGKSFYYGSYIYTPTPFIACLPSSDENSLWQYDITSEVKYDSEYNGGGGGGSVRSSLTRKALKVWENDNKQNRPKSVSVTLLKNGKAYDTVTLNNENNWEHIWRGLSKGPQWQIIENDVPENYTVTITKEGITFLVVNTYNETQKSDDTKEPDDPNKPTKSDDTNDPNNPNNPYDSNSQRDPDATDVPSDISDPNSTTDPHNTSEHEHQGNLYHPKKNDAPDASDNDANKPEDSPRNSQNTEANSKLPQTGMLWWPVPVLAIGGILLLLVGRVKQRTYYEDRKLKTDLIFITAGVIIMLSAAALTAANMLEQYNAEKLSAEALTKMSFDTPLTSEDVGETVIPDYVLAPYMDMPSENIDGLDYIGKLEIPSLGVVLPVAAEWSYKSLKKAPCCYSGSIYKNNMVIAGHNYRRHFGGLKSLEAGDDITFTDIKGNVFNYSTVEREILAPDKTEEMTRGEYPLTLFTCTLNGSSRVAVRCEAKQ